MFSDLRSWFDRISPSVKLNYYCKLLSIDHGNLSKFIHGYDKAVSLDSLIKLRDFIVEDLNNKIA